MKENDLLKKAQKLKAHGCTASQIFSEILSEFIDTPYVWGGNTVEGADCSGTVCAALSATAGYKIRETADDLYRKYFTNKASMNADAINAMFFLNTNGKAVHVCGSLSNGEFLNESRREMPQCGTVRKREELLIIYCTLP